MKQILVALASVFVSTSALSQACWNEREYKGQMLISASNCSENVSIPDFERGFCKSHVKGDVPKSAPKCPATVKAKEGAEVVTRTVVARCLGVKPPLAGGQANTFYYGGSGFKDSEQSLKQLCTGLEGKWVEGAK
ncbi:MAG: hypothetical protein JNM76_06325 [Betaproteobacteria bacterium]|nr:hypothetical protein [Betaproteobacteria bacterium]